MSSGQPAPDSSPAWPAVAVAVLSIAAAVATASIDPQPLRTYLGNEHTLAVYVAIALLGTGAIILLARFAGFAVLAKGRTLRGIAAGAVLATGFAAIVVTADLIGRFPADLNAPLPQALLFYPAIALIAESVFQILPLAAVLLLWRTVSGRRPAGSVLVVLIVLVSLIEPVFQLRLVGGSAGMDGLGWFTALHVFAFNLAQLGIYRRYDFVAMHAFRLVYYAWWHIAWGWLRLELLF